MVKTDKRKLHKLTGISSTAAVSLTTGHTLMSLQQNVYTAGTGNSTAAPYAKHCTA